MVTRVGGGVLLGALCVAVLAGLAFGGRWALGGTDVESLASIGILALIGTGALLIAIGGRAPFERGRIRWSLAALGVGALAIVGSGIRAGLLAFDPLEDALAVTLGLGGILVLAAGLVATALVLVARPGLPRVIAGALFAGLLAIVLTSVISAELALVGFGLIVLGLAGVGFIALRGEGQAAVGGSELGGLRRASARR